MRWLVGVDLRNLASGAVALADWMSHRAPTERFVGAHVVDFEANELFASIQPRNLEGVPEYVDELLAPLRADGAFVEVGSIHASAAEDGLVAAASDRGCDAMIIGRRKPAHGRAIVRLGRVARHLLRTLPRPIVVVPPDATAASFSDGPVLIATDLTATAGGAARFGATIAAAFDLDRLVTTVATVSDDVSPFVPVSRWSAIIETATGQARTRLASWVDEHGLSGARTSVVQGPVGAELLGVAKVSGASMIVVGSRGLGTFDRVFLSSVGTELAASAPIPVVVVPADWTAGHEAS
jgi:nucleotide-binding universal stress UspA family protein